MPATARGWRASPVARGRTPPQPRAYPGASSPRAPSAAIGEKEISSGPGGSSTLLGSAPRAAAAAPRQRIERTPEPQVQVDERLVNLSPGMAVTVEIKTGSRFRRAEWSSVRCNRRDEVGNPQKS